MVENMSAEDTTLTCVICGRTAYPLDHPRSELGWWLIVERDLVAETEAEERTWDICSETCLGRFVDWFNTGEDEP